MLEDRTRTLKREGPKIRPVKRTDIPELIQLFKLNYGDDYPYHELENERLIERLINDKNIIWLVLDDDGIVASGALIQTNRRHGDQIGELARLVVHPEKKGQGLAKRIINALLIWSDSTVELAYATARTAHSLSQKLMDSANFAAVGFLPGHHVFGDGRESSVYYCRLYGNGKALRREDAPRLIPEIRSLALHALTTMGLPNGVSVLEDVPTERRPSIYQFRSLDRGSLVPLLHVKRGRLVDPLLFGELSNDHGMALIRKGKGLYLVAADERQALRGAIGFQVDESDRGVKAMELIAENEDVEAALCEELVRVAEQDYQAEVIEVNVSAYEPGLQQTLLNLGFRPAAYIPAMFFHDSERLDVIKMIKLNIPYEPGPRSLTEPAQKVADTVEPVFRGDQLLLNPRSAK